MPEVEQGALAFFTFIGAYRGGLGGATHSDRVAPRGRVAGQQVLAMAFQPFKKAGIADQPVFDGLGIAGAYSRGGKLSKAAVSINTRLGW